MAGIDKVADSPDLTVTGRARFGSPWREESPGVPRERRLGGVDHDLEDVAGLGVRRLQLPRRKLDDCERTKSAGNPAGRNGWTHLHYPAVTGNEQDVDAESHGKRVDERAWRNDQGMTWSQ